MRTNGEGKPIIALDIDGTLGDYHRHFLWFAEQWLGKPMPPADQINPGLRLHKHMGIPLRIYRECKLAYRQGGLKRFMPCYPGASELTQALRRKGAEVWICTTRPYNRLDNIDPDTQEWLRRNKIKYDAILYGDKKYRELRRQVGLRVAGVLEDLPELWLQARDLFPWAFVCLRDQPYNQGVVQESATTPYFEPIKDLLQAKEVLLDAIDMWREGNEPWQLRMLQPTGTTGRLTRTLSRPRAR